MISLYGSIFFVIDFPSPLPFFAIYFPARIFIIVDFPHYDGSKKRRIWDLFLIESDYLWVLIFELVFAWERKKVIIKLPKNR